MLYLEDFPAGKVITHQGPTVTEAAIIEYASQYDPQYFHTDPEAAKNSIYGGLIASGWHTMSLTMRMLCDSYILHAASMGSPGVDQVRWHKPVRPGDTLSLKVTVTETTRSRSKPDRGIIRSTTETLNQHGEVVMSFNGMGMLKVHDV